jgi:hypothetical protein
LTKRDPEIKMNIVNNFLEILPALRKQTGSPGRLKYCDNCKEPSRNNVCKRCELIKILSG